LDWGRPATAIGHTARWRPARTRTTYRPVFVSDGIPIRSRPATRLPWRIGLGSPRRETTKSTRRSIGPTCSTVTEPADTTSSVPWSEKLRADTPVPGRASSGVGIGAGATVRLPALSRTLTVIA